MNFCRFVGAANVLMLAVSYKTVRTIEKSYETVRTIEVSYETVWTIGKSVGTSREKHPLL